MINDNTKPLILLGSNSALFFLQELCEQHNISIAGIIDSDYYGNTKELGGIPVIDSEVCFDDPGKLEHYKNNYNFFLATNWTNSNDPLHQRNYEKRKNLIEIIESKELPCISLVDKTARVHKSNIIGKSVIIDALVYISPNNIIGNYNSFYAATMIGYHNVIGDNVVFQRHSGIMHYNTIGNHVYIGLHSQICGDNLNIASGTVIHPCMAIKRSTQENELISLAGRDLRKVYPYFSIVE